jgi:hypothetical protein
VLRDVEIEGNTVLDEQAIRDIVSPYAASRLPARISKRSAGGSRFSTLIEGYINFRRDSFRIKTSKTGSSHSDLSGRVTDIDVSGTEHSIRNTLASGSRRRIAIQRAKHQEEQQILLQDPLVKRLNIELQPDLVPGEARLHADVLEANPYSLTLQVADDQSPTVGDHGQITGTAANILGYGDILAAQYGRSRYQRWLRRLLDADRRRRYALEPIRQERNIGDHPGAQRVERFEQLFERRRLKQGLSIGPQSET